MAEDRSVGGLYLRLGLSLSELETGFVTAERTVAANISRLNRESNLIRIRSEVEIAGLDETEDAERILQIRTEALNRQMAIQRDRVRILTAELQSLTAAHGENSTVAQRAVVRLERERLTLANLERDLRSLNDVQGESNNSFGELNDMLPAMPTKLQAVGMAFGVVTAGTSAAEKSVEALLEDFRELQNQAYELNMSVGKTRDFLRQLRLGGGDIGDFEGYIRGITDAFVKGEVDDPEFIALRKYGAEITDATGRLKDFKDLTEEVYQAWKKADEAGEGIEFLQLTGGESGIRDAIQFFKRYEEAVADAQKVMKAGIDDSQLHELDRVMKLVGEQAVELKNALGDIFVPAAQSAAEKFFNVLHDGTEYLVENKDALQKWGFVASEVFNTVADKVSGVTDWFAEIAKAPKDTTGDKRVDKILGDMSWRYGGTQQPAYGIDKMISGQVESAKKSFGVLDEFIKRGAQAQAKYNAEVSKTSELWQKVVETIKGGDKNPLNQYSVQRVQQFKDELADLRIELDFDNEIEKARARLDQWFDKEFTRKNFLSDDEATAIQELYSAKLEQIEKQKADYIKNIEAELSAEIESLHQTDLEKRLSQIENEKQAWINKGASESQAEQLAQEKIRQEYQKTQEKLNEIRQSVLAPDLSEYEKQFAAIEKEKQAWIQLGMEKVEAEELAQKKIQRAYEETAEKERTEFEKNMQARAKAQEDYIKKVQAAQEEAERKNAALRNEALSVLKQEAEEFAAYLKDGYAGLQKLMTDKLLESGVNPELLKKMTPENLDAYKNAKEQAQRGLLPNWEDPYSAEPVSKSLNTIPPAAANAAKSLDNLANAANNVGGNWQPEPYETNSASTNPLNVYTNPDGTLEITNLKEFANETNNTEQSLKDLGEQFSQMSEQLSKFQNENYDLSALSELPQEAQNFAQSFSAIPEVVQETSQAFYEIPSAVQGVTERLSVLEMPQFENVMNPFAGLESEIQNVVQRFSNMNFAVEEVVVKLNDLSAAIANFSLPNGNGNASATNEKTPVNVSTTVQIEEAHAWDYDHISELADKVADIIEPRIVSAVGGDSNSY